MLAVGLGKRERLQQYAVHDRKDGRVGADSKRQCGHRDGGETWFAAEHTAGVADIRPEGFHVNQERRCVGRSCIIFGRRYARRNDAWTLPVEPY